MPKNLKTVAVILGAGSGTRMRHPMPKQFIKIAGRPIIEHTARLLQDSEDIDEIMILITPGYKDEAKKMVKENAFTKVTHILEGGRTRNDTSRIAIKALGARECKILFHDAVRPLLSQRIIRDCVNALDHYESVDVAIPSADTIIATKNDIIQNIPDRKQLRRGQTPQGFRLSTIRKAYEIAANDSSFKMTDDCGVVLKYLPDVPIYVVEGSEQNMKVTHPVDIYLADRLFQLSVMPSPDQVNDKRRKEWLAGRTLVIFGGSYGIGQDIAGLAKKCGAEVFSFSRSTTNTYVEREDDVRKALKQAYDATGRVDCVINTAGLLRIGELSELNTEDLKEIISINYTAPAVIAQIALPYLKRTKGQLLLFTSSSYTRGRAGYSLYSSSKAAIVNLAQALADEWVKFNVKVNCINPERTATPMRKKAFGKEKTDSLLSSKIVAKAAIDTLISGITGQVIDVRRDAHQG